MNPPEDIYYGEDFYAIGDKAFEHCHVHLLCLDGTASFRFNGQPVRISRGDLVIYSNAELVAELQGSADLRVEYIVLNADFTNAALPSFHYGIGGRVSLFHNPVIPLTPDEAQRLHESMQYLRSRCRLKDTPFYHELVSALTLAFVYDLFNFHIRRDQGALSSYRPSIVVKQFLELIYAGAVRTHRDLRFYAGQLHVSERYLADTVRRLTGQCASDIIAKSTVTLITEMLRRSDLSVSQIAEALHFASVSYFSRYVQKHLGMTPTAYRSTLLPAMEVYAGASQELSNRR